MRSYIAESLNVIRLGLRAVGKAELDKYVTINFDIQFIPLVAC